MNADEQLVVAFDGNQDLVLKRWVGKKNTPNLRFPSKSEDLTDAEAIPKAYQEIEKTTGTNQESRQNPGVGGAKVSDVADDTAGFWFLPGYPAG